MNLLNKNIGWNFDNSYVRLPKILMSKIKPIKVKSPKIKIINYNLATKLNLNLHSINKKQLALIFSGNNLPRGTESIAQAYAGHQFGYFTMLGDGRATLIGEHIDNLKNRFDIQFKGSGKTPYSRNGDGRAAIGPMLREYLISEAMHGLNIPTTRSLAVVTTGEKVFRDKIQEGAILTRVASSHIRIGTFQFLAMQGNISALKKLVNYTINRHYPELSKNKNPAISLLEALIEKQISLIVNWMRVGFVHGVLNTDNVSLAGETIDYGPCAFIDNYNPKKVFSSIDIQGRYSFINQEIITHWNISRFAETLIPLFSKDKKKAINIGTNIINDFTSNFKKKWQQMMKKKLGFYGDFPEDEKFIKKILLWMETNNADYTNTFLYLMEKNRKISDIYNDSKFIEIYKEWKNRINKNSVPKKIYMKLMKINNPEFIPRNYLVEQALNDVNENDDYIKFNKLINIYKNPYKKNDKMIEFQKSPSLNFIENYKTFCGT